LAKRDSPPRIRSSVAFGEFRDERFKQIGILHRQWILTQFML
jgi:hypothetical protein